ncbi:hypothetical protein QYF36_014748 [Acer negundo]|nr:hypothetical protein QYF36_014748 [Acer negundo]
MGFLSSSESWDFKESFGQHEILADGDVSSAIFAKKSKENFMNLSAGIYRCVECDASLQSKTTKPLNDLDLSTQDEHKEDEEIRCRFYGTASITKKAATNEERERTNKAAKVFEPANPLCSVVMRSTYV